MKRRVYCSLLCTLIVYLFMSFLNFMSSPNSDILDPVIWYIALITFIVSFISYGMGERSNDKQD